MQTGRTVQSRGTILNLGMSQDSRVRSSLVPVTSSLVVGQLTIGTDFSWRQAELKEVVDLDGALSWFLWTFI